MVLREDTAEFSDPSMHVWDRQNWGYCRGSLGCCSVMPHFGGSRPVRGERRERPSSYLKWSRGSGMSPDWTG